jgi:SAM-dependent methyltransferase
MHDDQSQMYYTKGTFWEGREASESAFKLELVLPFFHKYPNLLLKQGKYADLGCGQGSFLLALAQYLDNLKLNYELYGYDISPYAIELANKFADKKPDIVFRVGSCLDLPDDLDLIFINDVVEHVENPYQLLRDLARKSKYVIMHLPIEQSISHMLMRKPSSSYNLFRHLHFFSWETARILINHSPFKIIDFQFTGAAATLIRITKKLQKIQNLLRYALYRLSPPLASVIGGGPVMLLLERKPEASQP